MLNLALIHIDIICFQSKFYKCYINLCRIILFDLLFTNCKWCINLLILFHAYLTNSQDAYFIWFIKLSSDDCYNFIPRKYVILLRSLISNAFSMSSLKFFYLLCVTTYHQDVINIDENNDKISSSLINIECMLINTLLKVQT